MPTGDGSMPIVVTLTASLELNGIEIIVLTLKHAVKTVQLMESQFKTGPIPMELTKSIKVLR
jgi:hypothetical protein